MTTALGVPLLRLASAGASHAACGTITAIDAGADDDGLSAFFRVRPRLFGIAYRILGSAAEAEDTVQDAWVRWQTTNRSVVRNAPAFLARATTRLAINVVRSARSRRETPTGPWVREPVDTSADAGSRAERGEALRSALLLLQESLPPRDRAVYVLREAFDYPFRKIARILGLEEAHARQLATRARQRLADGRRASMSSGAQGRLLDAFMGASRRGDLTALEGALVSDIASCMAQRRSCGPEHLPPHER